MEDWDAGNIFHSSYRTTVFLWKKIPEPMKGLGKGIRSFNDGMNEVETDLKEVIKSETKSEDYPTKSNDV